MLLPELTGVLKSSVRLHPNPCVIERKDYYPNCKLLSSTSFGEGEGGGRKGKEEKKEGRKIKHELLNEKRKVNK